MVQELLGVQTISGGSVCKVVVGGGSQRNQISLSSHLECTKMPVFPHLLTKKSPKNVVVYLKVLNKIYSKTILRNTLI
jgi:hypothetical protein